MSGEPDDPLLETALEITDAGAVDWESVRAAHLDEPGTVEALESIARLTGLADALDDGDALVATATGGADAGEEAGAAPAHGRWGPLELRQRVGAGSFAEVYVAYDPKLQREVALKLHRRWSAERSRRWLDEARRLARVRHPNVVAVYGADVHDGRAGLWMELVRGRTLEERLRREGPLGAREAALIGIDLCGALAAVHAAGLAHGDVKPGNVVREGRPGVAGDPGRIVLMDFGSAHDSAIDDAHAPGTPLATAPEVLAGGRTTPASDLWSLGALLHRLVSGRWPVEARSLEELLERHGRGEVRSLRAARPGLPGAFIAAVDRALAHAPKARPRDAVEFERELLAVLGADPGSSAETARRARRARATRRGFVAAGALVVLAGLAWAAGAHGPRVWMAWRTRTLPLTTHLEATRAGVSANAWYGSVLRTVGDLDGDGATDVLASAPGAGEGGRAYLLTPSRSGLTPVLTFHGERPGDSFGAAEVPGDLDADGHADLVVSSVFYDGPGGRDAGRVYVYSGGTPIDTTADHVFEGRHDTQYCGWGLGGGDVNGDGVSDLLIGAPYDNTAGPQAGRVYVLFGGRGFDVRPDLELAPDGAGGSFGQTVAYLGDWNGDGGGDFVVSAFTHAGGGQRRGRAFVYFGGALLDDRADVVIDGPHDQALFGVVRTPAADLNADGWPDLVLGAERGPGLERMAGSVSIYFGGPQADEVADLVLRGERAGDGFGMFTSTVSDADGDGIVDLLVGAPWHDEPGMERAGRVYLYRGGPRMDEVPDAIVRSTTAEGTLGWSGCVVPAADGRGPGRLLLGARSAMRPHNGQGAIELHALAHWQVLAPGAGDGWWPGGAATLRWRGPTHANVALSSDGGASWRTVARAVGGRAVNALRVAVPADAAGAVRVRLTPAARDGRGAVEREFRLGR